MSQTTVAQLLSDHIGRRVPQSTVSAHENGQRWGDNPDLIGAYAAVLNIPAALIQRVIGLPVPHDDDDEYDLPLTFRQVVESDPTLSAAAKKHLVSQYGLMQAASAYERATGNSTVTTDEQSAR